MMYVYVSELVSIVYSEWEISKYAYLTNTGHLVSSISTKFFLIRM